MIDFSMLERRCVELSDTFQSATPFPHLIVDDACDAEALREALPAVAARLARPKTESGDLIFARNKFVDSEFERIHPLLDTLRDEILSPRFSRWLSDLVGKRVFLDPGFYGGGLHAGGRGSYLDMHTDFSYHPEHLSWHRRLNLLLYLNQSWMPEHGGELLLQHIETPEREPLRVAPLFNRLVIMETSDASLHGYDPIAFPDGAYRLSIASYAYELEPQRSEAVRSTVWYPRHGGVVKRAAGKVLPKIIGALRSFRPPRS